MSDIAKFGIEVDPKEAVSGSRKAKRAIKGVGDEAQRTQRKVTRSNRAGGRSSQAMARQSQGAFAGMAANAINLLGSLGLLNNGFGSLIQRGQNVAQTSKAMAGSFKGTSAAASNAAGAAGGMALGIRGIAAAAGAAMISLGPLLLIIGAIIAALAALVIALKAAAFGFSLLKKGVALSAEMQQTKVAVEVLVGSTEKAVKVLKDMKDLSDSTPLSPKAVQDAGRSLLAFGSSTETVVGELRRIGDVALGVQAPIGEIATLYGKARVQGTLFAEDINQLTNRGIPILEIFAAQLGVSVSQVKKMGSEGKISFDNLERAFVTLTDEGGQFSGMMERMSQTFSGKVSTMSGLWNSLLAAMGEPIRDALSPLLDDLIWLIREATPYARKFGEAIGASIKILYQAFSNGQIMELYGLSLLAGAEMGVNGFWELYKSMMAKITVLMVTAFEWTAIKLSNALKITFTGAVNFFKLLLLPVMVWLTSQFNKMAVLASKVPGVDVGLAQAPSISLNKAKTDDRSFSQMQEDNAGIGDSVKGLLGTVPTFFRDKLSDMAGGLIAEFDADNPGIAPLERDPLPTKTTPGGDDGNIPNAIKVPSAEKAAKEVKELSEQTKNLLEDFGNLQAGIDNLTANTILAFSDGFTEAFSSIALGTASIGEAFGRMASQVIAGITQMIIKLTVQLAIQKLIASYGGGGAGGSLLGAIAGLPTAHAGGVAGAGGLPKTGNVGLSTFHSGGITGAEAAVKVDRNETILTRKRSDELEMQLADKRGSSKESGGQNERPIQFLNITDPSMISDAIAANPDMIVNAISRRQKAVRNMMTKNR